MAATNDSNSLPAIHISLPIYAAPDAVLTAPSPVKFQCYYYSILSQPPLVTHSSVNIWLELMGPKAYLLPKESTPISLHPL